MPKNVIARNEAIPLAHWIASHIVTLVVAMTILGGTSMAMNVASSAFDEGTNIPKKYTCEGTNVSPQLQLSGIPAGTKSIALICDDPDAPMGTWVHWLLYNLPADTTTLAEGIAKTDSLPNGAAQGVNSGGKVGYDGPCPPPGNPHRYFFKVYALDTKLSLASRTTKKDVEAAMQGHILDKAAVMGKYQR